MATWLGQLIVVRRQPAFTTLLSLAEEASGQLPGSISWKKFTRGQTINERKVGQRDPATGPSFKEKALGEPHKVLEDNHEAVSRCFRDHQEEVRPRGWVHLGRSLHCSMWASNCYNWRGLCITWWFHIKIWNLNGNNIEMWKDIYYRVI